MASSASAVGSLVLFWIGGIVAFFILLFLSVVPDVRGRDHYEFHECEVLKGSIIEQKRECYTGNGCATVYRPLVHVSYNNRRENITTFATEVPSKTNSNFFSESDATKWLAQFVPGNKYPCFVNPTNPTEPCMSLHFNARWIICLIIVVVTGLVFLLLPLGALVFIVVRSCLGRMGYATVN